MKKFFISILISISFSNLFAQKITLDKIDQEGFRIIATDYKYVSTGWTDTAPIGYSICATSNDGVVQYSIDINISSLTNFKIPTNGLMLIKTSNNDVIECKNTIPEHRTDDPIGTYDEMAKMIIHDIKGSYNISYPDLKKISELGISKIRIEKQGNLLDIEYNKKRINITKELFNSRLKLVSDALSKKKDIRSDF